MTYSLDTVFGKWGVPDHPVEISSSSRDFLTARLGPASQRPAVAVGSIPVPAVGLSEGVLRELADAIGADHVDTGRPARLRHAVGSSTLDLIAVRDGAITAVPDAVLRPASHDEVVALLGVCARNRVAVVPFGGGTSVVGGVAPQTGGHDAVVAIAFDRMAELLGVDGTSLTATVQPGITGPVLERLLQSRGLTWGHLPQSWQRATIGGYIATRSAGQASTGYGRSDESVESVVLATPTGTVRLGWAPTSAAGPDLRQVFIGSEGVFGVITSVTLRVRRLPTYSRYEGLMFPDHASGVAAFRALAQADLTATVMRLSDKVETEVTLTLSGPQGLAREVMERYFAARGVSGGCLSILGWEGYSPMATKARRQAAWRALRHHGAVPLGGGVGRSWRKHRFEGPYLRDTLLDEGYIVETLETAGEWSSLQRLNAAVVSAISGALADPWHEPLVFGHLSHIYPAGASLYYTVLARAEPDRSAQWVRAKDAACEAIMANGGTITHHHAIGSQHRPWMRTEVGDVGVDVLRAVKAAVDPEGIMNPGKLIPADR